MTYCSLQCCIIYLTYPYFLFNLFANIFLLLFHVLHDVVFMVFWNNIMFYKILARGCCVHVVQCSFCCETYKIQKRKRWIKKLLKKFFWFEYLKNAVCLGKKYTKEKFVVIMNEYHLSSISILWNYYGEMIFVCFFFF